MKKFKKVLLLGSGALKIGQAGEFDYSGSQALKALSEEGIFTVLINPNIATVQTSEGVADSVYLLPVTPYFVEKVIEKERPDGIMLTFGGQTALNCGVALDHSGVLAKYGVSVLGTPVQAIVDTEDRDAFAHRMEEIDVSIIRSHAVDSIEAAREAAREIGYPVILRSAYALGGLGSGFCNNEAELDVQAGKAFAYSPQVLVEKSLKGWKEVEYEVVRDCYDNCITVCNMENFDPLGIHTGESIVVAPCQTLNNHDINLLRDTAIRIVRHLGIIGECNVQYGYDPDSDDYRVIEVNARLSRSSALASKATGYPLAFIAAKLGLGYGLFELSNSVTKCTPAFFEPALDYVVCKIPRWDLRKFHGVSRKIGSSMKSVGEVMAIGRNFEESLQKGLRMIGQGAHGFVINKTAVPEDLDAALSEPDDTRIFAIAHAFDAGYTIERIHELTKIDAWFLHKLRNIFDTGLELRRYDDCCEIPDQLLLQAKRQGFSDHQIAHALYKGRFDADRDQDIVRAWRKSRGIVPCVKQIDTLAAEFPALTNYLYLTYNGSFDDIDYEHDGRSVIVLGSGAYRIGSSVEFDWCSVTALQTIRKAGWRGVMINYNPETVSTDYDICDRLYFEELTLERVLDICDLEQPHGTVVSVGGQIPNNLAVRLDGHRIPILGTRASDIDRAEDRHKFSSIVDALGIDQPKWMELTSRAELDGFIARVGYPVLIRPSYVLSGAAMHVCYDATELDSYLSMAVEVSQQHPVVVSEFMQRCKEIEFDAVADGGRILAYGISEHVEFAGVHSGDATIVFPAQKIYLATMKRLKAIAGKIAEALHITGPFNIQFLAKDNFVKVIECNLRASRSFPFVSKVSKVNMIELATQAMLGEHPAPVHKDDFDFDYVGVKASQFSFARLLRADPVLGVDMASTGEAGCMGDDFNDALLKAVESVGYPVPDGPVLISSGDALQKADLLEACRQLAAKGYTIYATKGTQRHLEENGVPALRALWPDEDSESLDYHYEAALDLIRSRKVRMVINIPKNYSATELTNGYKIRRAAVDFNVPLFTNARLATAFVKAFCNMTMDDISIKASDEFKLNT